MNDEKVVEIMIDKIESIVREIKNDDLDPLKSSDKKNVSKIIIKELDEVLENENK